MAPTLVCSEALDGPAGFPVGCESGSDDFALMGNFAMSAPSTEPPPGRSLSDAADVFPASTPIASTRLAGNSKPQALVEPTKVTTPLNARQKKQKVEKKDKAKASSQDAGAGKQSWQTRQKAQREMAQAEKCITPLEVLGKMFHDPGCPVAVNELASLKAKIGARLEAGVRWIFLGEDVDETGDAAAAETERSRRRYMFDRLKAGQQFSRLALPMLKCYHATSPTKDEANYCVNQFKATMEDAAEEHMAAPFSIQLKCRQSLQVEHQ